MRQPDDLSDMPWPPLTDNRRQAEELVMKIHNCNRHHLEASAAMRTHVDLVETALCNANPLYGHGCLTGDCPHLRQDECDMFLLKTVRDWDEADRKAAGGGGA